MRASLRTSLATIGWLGMASWSVVGAQTPKPAPSAPATKAAPRPSSAGKPALVPVVPNQGKAPVTEVLVELRADGLAYLPAAAQPFTGKAITASKAFEDCVESITPYKNGRLHGDMMTLYKAGNPKTVRTYADGVARKQVAYYPDGAKKFEQSLNAKDKAEGPYTRWFASGKVQAEATYDDDERWHGENKEFFEDGKLKAHYVYEHGKIVKVVFESPAAKAEREAPPKPPAPPKQ